MKIKCLASFIFSLLLICVQAQLELLSILPPCSATCVIRSLVRTACNSTDIACLCTDQQLWDDVTVCNIAECTTRESLTSQQVASRACSIPLRDKSKTLPVVNTILTGIAGIFLSLRIIARSPRRWELLGWDDGLIAISFITSVPLTVADWFLAHTGLGRDIWEVSFSNIDRTLLWFWIAEPFYLWSTIFMKISILLFYLRVFVEPNFRKIVFSVMTLCAATLIAFTFALIFQCAPISYAWTHWDRQVQGTCVNLNAGIWTHAAINMALDLIVLVLPLLPLLRLQFSYSWQSKLQIAMMFGIGLLITVVSGLRLAVLIRTANTLNPTWSLYEAALWSGIEVWVGVICACLPTARVFVMRMLLKWLGMSYGKSSMVQHEAHVMHRKVSSKQILSWKSTHSQHEPIDRRDGTAPFVELKSVHDIGDFGMNRAVRPEW